MSDDYYQRQLEDQQYYNRLDQQRLADQQYYDECDKRRREEEEEKRRKQDSEQLWNSVWQNQVYSACQPTHYNTTTTSKSKATSSLIDSASKQKLAGDAARNFITDKQGDSLGMTVLKTAGAVGVIALSIGLAWLANRDETTETDETSKK